MPRPDEPTPVLPDYAGGCLTNIVPGLLVHPDASRGTLPDEVLDAHQVVLFLIDGLGWRQLQDRRHLAPTLAGLAGGPVTTVAPSTTSTALTSLTTGTEPGAHGVVGYRMRVGGEVLNALRWTTPSGDARESVVPEDFQPVTPFAGAQPPVITRIEFTGGGFSGAHLRGSMVSGYWVSSSIPVLVGQHLRRGAPFVYAYYDGIDKIAHAEGLGVHYDAELAYVDAMVAKLLDTLPAGAALVITADHGQVHVGDRIETIDVSVMDAAQAWSGEARFVWLHARQGREQELLDVALEQHGHHAWVRSQAQILDEGWFGPRVTGPARGRLGDVALIPHEPIALVPPDNLGPPLIGRHGALTSAEMHVPLLTAVA